MNLQISHHKIKHFKSMFDSRTYSNFQVVVKGILALRDWKEADLALFGEKTLRQIQFFFNGAKWSCSTLNEYRLRFLRNKPNFADRKSDFAVLDGSAIEKNKDSCFSGLAEAIYSNKLKQIVNGFYLLGASVITNNGTKYILDFNLFFSERWESSTKAWKAFAQKIVTKSNAWIIIVDSGFKGKHFCSYIYKVLHRQFLIRLDCNHTLLINKKNYYLPKGKKRKGRKRKHPNHYGRTITKLLKDTEAIELNKGKMWVFKNVLIKSWLSEFTQPVQIIVFLQKGRKTPMVLATSVDIEMFSDVEYYEFVEMYYKRWSIEMLFKEVKSWFCFGKFRLIAEESIVKYMHIIVFCHTLLSIFLETINNTPELRLRIVTFLKNTRNIKKKLTVIGLKLFCESMVIKTSVMSFKLLYLNKHQESKLLFL